MNEIIKIENKNGIETVNAYELYEFLEIKSKFADWIKNKIKQYDFKENTDFIKVSKKLETSGGLQTGIEYHISISMAKDLSMVENNKKGKQAREYFKNCEKALKNVQLNIAEIVAAEIKKQLKTVKPKQVEGPKIKVLRSYTIGTTWVKQIEFKNHKYQVMRNFYNHEKCDLRFDDREYGSLIKQGFITIEQCYKYVERNL